MATSKTVKVECQCGCALLEYSKSGKGRLIKCYLANIRSDQVGLIDLPIGARPLCPDCGKRLGDIRMVHGKPALKLNQGAIKKIRL